MSVCAAALAEDSKAIVCVADKALSYGYLQWDSDTSKIIPVGNATTTMISDEGYGPRVLSKLIDCDFTGLDVQSATHLCETKYREAFDDLVEATYLRPRLLTAHAYFGALIQPKVNHILRSLADEIKEFSIKVDLIVAGFYSGSPLILSLSSPGIANNITGAGFHAVGSGWEKAVSRILFAPHERTHSIERTLFDVFDAKANAEMAFGVGVDWDAVVLVEGKPPTQVPKNIKRIIEQLWICRENQPFEISDDEDIPPRTWKRTLRKFAESCLALPISAETQAVKSSNVSGSAVTI